MSNTIHSMIGEVYDTFEQNPDLLFTIEDLKSVIKAAPYTEASLYSAISNIKAGRKIGGRKPLDLEWREPKGLCSKCGERPKSNVMGRRPKRIGIRDASIPYPRPDPQP